MNRFIFMHMVLASLLLTASNVQARSFKTMHAENDLPRPAGIAIADARPDQVVLYCTRVSASCKGMREHLHKMGIDFLDKDPKSDPVAGTEFDALGGQGVPLVVFKHRLMHGYYPTSFDRLYAKYHTGSESAPAARHISAPASPRTASADSAQPEHLTLSSQRGAVVEDIAPDSIKAYLDRHQYVVVLYTSPDSTCPPCVSSQPPFEQAAASGLSIIRYVRVQWSPWWETPASVKALHNKKYLPAFTVYLRGKAVAHQGGGVEANHLNAYMEKRFGFAP